MAGSEFVQEKRVFELGFVFAGAVSAGAYSAGVVDFLIEALDKWYAAKKQVDSRDNQSTKQEIPPHDISIEAISGSSAGGMVAALTAVSLCEDITPIRPSKHPEKDKVDNKLYSGWVFDADMVPMLSGSDLENKNLPLSSLLNPSVIEEIAEKATNVQWRGKSREYVADQMKIFICVTNLRGVPYSIDYIGPTDNNDDHGMSGQSTPRSGNIEHEMSNHADYFQFTLVKPEVAQGIDLNNVVGALNPAGQDEKTKSEWKILVESAVASGAFPLALKPRLLTRCSEDYELREWALPLSTPKTEKGRQVCSSFEKINPDWHGKAPKPFQFLSVDAGVLNNEPMELVRLALAGDEMRNERRGDKATRAVIMIDPFPNHVPLQRVYKPKTGLISVIGAMFESLMAQANFKADDLKLAQDGNVFSRFLIAPTRDVNKSGGDKNKRSSIASNSLFHFAGFLDEKFRRHDFLLGRRNCQRFLQQHLVLPATNPLFDGWPENLKRPGSPYYVTRIIEGKKEGCLPIIPLVSRMSEEEPVPGWPDMSEDKLDALRKSVKFRTGLVIKKLIRDLLGSKGIAALFKFLIIIFSPLIQWLVPGWLTGKIMNEIRNNLTSSGLLHTSMKN